MFTAGSPEANYLNVPLSTGSRQELEYVEAPTSAHTASSCARHRRGRAMLRVVGLAILCSVSMWWWWWRTCHGNVHRENDADSGVDVFPVRILFFRHGFTCGNAGPIAGCSDPNVPMLRLTADDQDRLFDKLDDIGTNRPAPKVLPRLNRKFGIERRGKTYTGGDPPRPLLYKGADCMVHVQPWTSDSQWHEAGNVIEMHHFFMDAPLTHCSEIQSTKAGGVFRSWLKSEGIKFDFLGASTLARTFETAHYQLLAEREAWIDVFSPEMLQGEAAPLVSQLPFVNEYNPTWGYQADDFAWPREEQREHLISAIGADAVAHLDYSHLDDFTEEERVGHDWEAFKEKVLGRRLVPFILQRKGEPLSVKLPSVQNGDCFERSEWGTAAKLAAGSSGEVRDILNIGMASHSGIIQEFCNLEGSRVSNNAVVEMLLLVEARNGGSEIVVRQESGSCNLVMDAPDPPEDLDRRDVANCVHPFNFSLAFVSSASSTERTKCEELSLPADAYPTFRAARLNLES